MFLQLFEGAVGGSSEPRIARNRLSPRPLVRSSRVRRPSSSAGRCTFGCLDKTAKHTIRPVRGARSGCEGLKRGRESPTRRKSACRAFGTDLATVPGLSRLQIISLHSPVRQSKARGGPRRRTATSPPPRGSAGYPPPARCPPGVRRSFSAPPTSLSSSHQSIV